jgi:CysZ protein
MLAPRHKRTFSWVARPGSAKGVRGQATPFADPGRATRTFTRYGPVAGLRAFLGGIGFVLITPSVWRYALVPVAMLFLLAIGFSVAGVWAVMRGFDFHGAGLGSWLVHILFSLIAVLIGGFLALCLAQPFSAFALNAIALAQQEDLTSYRPEQPGVLAAMLHSAVATFIMLLLGCPALLSLLVAGLLYPPLLAITVPLKFLVLGWLLAWNFLDYPFTLRGSGLTRRFQWVIGHFGAFTTFGLLWASFMIVPGIILVFLPVAVAGATRLVIISEDLSDARWVPGRSGDPEP